MPVPPPDDDSLPHDDAEPGAGEDGIDFDDTSLDFDDDEALLDEEFPLGDGVAELAGQVECPYCGESVEIALDPGSGNDQEYVEDCAVCCRPWMVHVHYDEDGTAHVYVDANDDQDAGDD